MPAILAPAPAVGLRSIKPAEARADNLDSMYTFISAYTLAAALASSPQPETHERILVTAVASRVAEGADATPATTSVIEREDLDRSISRDIREALRYEPGVSVETSPARFGAGNIAIRGLDGNRVQMLEDGIRLPDGYRVGSFSNASRNPFEVALLSRIEILRGPGSALYGSDALAGVVSMTTIDPKDVMRPGAAFGGFADAGYGSADDSVHGSGALAAKVGGAELLVAGARSSGHERETKGEVDAIGATRTVANPQDASAGAGLAKVTVPTSGGGFWRGTWERFERRVETDVLSLNPQSPRTVTLAGDDRAERTRASLDALVTSLGFVDRLTLLAYGQRSRTTQDTVEVRANTTAACLSAAGSISCRREARFDLAQREFGATAIAQTATGAHNLVYGAEASRTRVEESRDGRQVNLDTGTVTNVVGTDIFPTRDFPQSRVDRLGAFAQDDIDLGAWRLVPALRYDRFDMQPEPDATYAASNPGRTPVALSDSAWSPKLGAHVPIGGGVALAMQAATGFRAPPYFDVNVGLSNLPLGYTVIPNPDLQPETSRGFEAGLRGRHRIVDWSLTAYRTDYHDLIVSRAPLPCPGDPRCAPGAPITFQSQNVTRARIEGLEARAELRVAPAWTMLAGGAASRGEDRSKGAPLNSIDPPKVVVGLAYQVAPGAATPQRPGAQSSGAQFHVTHAWAKSSIDQSAGTLFATPAYTIADLTGQVRIGSQLTLSAGVYNLTDRKYWLWSDVRGVLNPGASIDRYTQPGRSYAVQAKVEF